MKEEKKNQPPEERENKKRPIEHIEEQLETEWPSYEDTPKSEQEPERRKDKLNGIGFLVGDDMLVK